MKLAKILLLFIVANFIARPASVSARVYINEVAWMGSAESQYGEWIELYNDSSEAVDLKDAAIYEAGGNTLLIRLTKTIAPSGYYLIARSTPSMPDPVGGMADDLGSFGGSGLSNSGEHLVLKSAIGDILDTVDGSAGWPAGDSAQKLTMQLSGGSWISATGTPRASNVVATSVSSESTTVPTSDDGISNSGAGKDTVVLSSHSSPSDLSQKKDEAKIFASAGRNRLSLAGSPISFEGKLFNSKGEAIDGWNFSWSFGDGRTATGKYASHTYRFPGDYAVVLTGSVGGEEYIARAVVKVVKPEIDISDVGSDFVEIKNGSIYEANIGGWSISSDETSFALPRDTIITAKNKIIIPLETVGFRQSSKEVNLMSPDKKRISTFTMQKQKDETAMSGVDEGVSGVSVGSDTEEAVLVISSLERKLLEAKSQLLSIENKQTSRSASSVAGGKKVDVTVGNMASVSQSIQPIEESRLNQEGAGEVIVDVVEKPRSVLQIFLAIPAGGLRFLRDLIF